MGSHNCARDKTGDWQLLSPLESKKAANPNKDPEQAAAQPVTQSGVSGSTGTTVSRPQ